MRREGFRLNETRRVQDGKDKKGLVLSIDVKRRVWTDKKRRVQD